MQIPFCGGAYLDDTIAYDLQRCVNLYVEYSGAVDPKTGASSSKNISKLVGTPGLNLSQGYQLIDSSNYGLRALYHCQIQNVLIAIWGNTVYRISVTGGAITVSGNINTSSGQVSIQDNGFQVAIADGQAYYFNIDDVAPTLINLNVEAIRVLFNDTYLIFITPDSPVFFISGNDNVTLDAADYASIQNYPQNINGAEIVNGYLILLGTNTGEVWQDTGDQLFPFGKIPGVVIETGCASQFTLQKVSTFVCWLATDARGGYMVYQSNGFGFNRISTHALEWQLATYDIDSSYAFTYQQRGHFFYVLQFPTDNKTWVYDFTTTLWHERDYTLAETDEKQCWLASCHAFFNGKNLVGDRRNGNIYALDYDTYTDNGTAIHRIRTTPHYAELDDYQYIVWWSMTIDMTVGNADQEGQGSDPIIMLEASNDGGYTWPIYREGKIGKIGEYRNRVLFRRLGKSRNRVYRLSITDPIKVSIFGASTRTTIAKY